MSPRFARRLLAAALLTLPAALHAADLTIPAGSTYTVTPAQAELRLDRLEIGDKATVRFADGVTRWRVEAARAAIGSGVAVDGRGVAGQAGAAAADRSGRAASCAAGASGAAGSAGTTGGSGVAIAMKLGIERLGGLQVLADGGSGGAGGAGGEGQRGGETTGNCKPAAGGAGGLGGAGGEGGNGGAVTIAYYGVGGVDTFALADQIKVSSAAGRGGDSGKGGSGAKGGEGGYALTSTPMGRSYSDGGKSGAQGEAGAAGRSGAAGQVSVQEIAVGAAPAATRPIAAPVAVPAAAMAADPQALLQRIEALEARVKALEAR